MPARRFSKRFAVAAVLVVLCIMPFTAFAAETSDARQYQDWVTFIYTNDTERFVVSQTRNERDIFEIKVPKTDSLPYYLYFAIAHPIERTGVDINEEVQINCNFSIDNGNIYQASTSSTFMDETSIYFLISGNFSGSAVTSEMSRGHSITFRFYDEDFEPYTTTFSLMGFTDAAIYANYLCKKIFGK